jgi:hypothetical protein
MNMKLVIEHDGVKRVLGFPLGICGDRAAIEYLVQELQAHLADEGWCYGWTFIRPPYDGASPPNTAPLPWRDAQPASEKP